MTIRVRVTISTGNLESRWGEGVMMRDGRVEGEGEGCSVDAGVEA